MGLSNGGGGYQVGPGNRAEIDLVAVDVPRTATSTATLTAAQVTNGMLVANPSTTAATYTLPTALQIDDAVPNAVPGHVFDLRLINIGTLFGSVTLAAAAGITDGGNAFVAVPVTSSAAFRFRKTGDAAWTVYKIA